MAALSGDGTSEIRPPGPLVNDETPRLSVRGLTKRFRKLVAVDSLHLALGSGEIVGLIGPNGAGKSTTMKLITGQLLADTGTVAIDGHDAARSPLAARARTGYVPQDVDLYPFLTSREVLEFVAAARELSPDLATPRISELLDRFELGSAQHRLTREYSLGMARKLAIAAALLGDPALLVLDEPLNGLDPRAAHEVKAVLAERARGGTTVLIVSHLLDAMERLCTRVVLLHAGRVAGELGRGELEGLRAAGTSLEAWFLERTASRGAGASDAESLPPDASAAKVGSDSSG
jgi:ABC-2 type transport system ATP-binding protein